MNCVLRRITLAERYLLTLKNKARLKVGKLVFYVFNNVERSLNRSHRIFWKVTVLTLQIKCFWSSDSHMYVNHEPVLDVMLGF